DLLGEPGGMDELMRRQRDAEAELDVLGDLRQRGEHRLVARHVRAVLAEMVLDAPDRVKSVPVGVDDLLDAFAIDLTLGGPLTPWVLAGPGLRYVELVEESQLHRSSPHHFSTGYIDRMARVTSILAMTEQPWQAPGGKNTYQRIHHINGC